VQQVVLGLYKSVDNRKARVFVPERDLGGGRGVGKGSLLYLSDFMKNIVMYSFFFSQNYKNTKIVILRRTPYVNSVISDSSKC
jgi:hypothetical protein